MDKILNKIAKEYVIKVEETFTFILRLLNVKNRRELTQYVQNQGDINFVIDGKKYIIMPHGRGCYFSDGQNEIDWEFGDNCVCGIDPWMLSKYVKHYYPELYKGMDSVEIKKSFELAYQLGEVQKKYELYYL